VKFAIVDIETTGLYHQGHGITEIAIIHLEEGRSELAFHSLVNPKANISGYISELTGIDGKMVETAPDLDSLIPQIKAALDNRIFVAHNVNFDYQFLKAAFRNNNLAFQYHRFCTMRYARKVLPKLRSHKLGVVLKHLGIDNEEEHRAAGDAWATAELLIRLQTMDDQGHFKSLIKQNSHHTVLPPNISEDDIRALPSGHGVYFFYNQQKKPIYIGKAKNLKRRVLSHFTSSGSSRRKMIFQREVYRIEYQRTRSEYESLLVEDASIKKYWPRYNRAQKERTQKYTVVPYKNRCDEIRLAILKTKQRTSFPSFNSYNEAKVWLYRALIEEEISPGIAGLAEPEDFEASASMERVEEFVKTDHGQIKGTFLLVGSEVEETLAFAIINGKYAGYGPFKKDIDSIDTWVDHYLNRAEESATAQNIISQMLNDENIIKYEFKD
jgi:DNA polymerase-3 subunit epsilon